MNPSKKARSRRRFLQQAAALAAAAPAAQGAGPLLPTVKFGKTGITRMIIGSNPFYGYSHFNRIFDESMREWYTPDRRQQVLRDCERHGINTWQVHYNDQPMDDFRRYRAEGGKMNLILLADFDLMTNPGLLPKVAKLGPLGIAHHGSRTDARFRAGEMGKVRDFLKAVRDSGVMVGLSTHNPAVVDTVESEGWDLDFYQTCLYRVTRTAEEARTEYGEAPVGEIYMEKDPERMFKMIRATPKPCLAFKLFAAGRKLRTGEVEEALRLAFANIKAGDAVIVGMYPRYSDQVAEDTALARRILARLA